MMNRIAKSLLAVPRLAKRLIAMSADALLCLLTLWLALSLEQGSWQLLHTNQWLAGVLSLLLVLPVFTAFGLYRTIFRYVGVATLVAVFEAIFLYGVLYAALLSWLALPGVSALIGALQPLLLLLAVGGLRTVTRFALSSVHLTRLERRELPRVLIYGAGSAGNQLAAAIASSAEMKVVGFLDDDAQLHGAELNGLPIYNPGRLHVLAGHLAVRDVLLAIPSANRQRRNEILELTGKAHVAVRTLPGLMDLANGHVQTSDLRELDIEDLLGRDAVPPKASLIDKNIRGKVVLVSGAGGSIGSELCRQIIKAAPTKLLLVERNEYALYAVHQDLMQALVDQDSPDVQLLPLLASVGDEDRMRQIMSTWRPHTVYHAAAYKHVPLVEHNPAAGVKNNVLGTWTAARMAAECGVLDFVLISTDKAVRPTNIMGASKRLAEMVLQALAAMAVAQGWETNFSLVRFGNVLGSSGSVVPLFRKQIKAGGPVTLTHADVTRYFMTIPEAAQLVIQAGAMATGGDVFVLDMGEPVRISDLARRMVELSGLSVRNEQNRGGDIEINVTGLRPGEKLFEELLIGDNPMPTQHPHILTAHERFVPWPELTLRIEELREAISTNDVPAIRGLLQELVTGYQPDGEVVDWVHLAREEAVEDIFQAAFDSLNPVPLPRGVILH